MRAFFDDDTLLDIAPKVSVRTHAPLRLSRVVLSAQSTADFEQAKDEEFEKRLEGRLVRQDELLLVGEGAFSVVMCEPTLQGVIRSDSTQIYVSCDQVSNTDAPTSSRSGRASDSDLDVDDGDDLADMSNVIVDESFLARGVLGSTQADGATEDISESIFADGPGVRLDARSIADLEDVRDALVSWASRSWRDVEGTDLDNCILLDEAAFPQLGAVEGDWALIRIHDGTKTRAVKMLCAPDDSKATIRAAAHLSPLLLQSLNGGKRLEKAQPIPTIVVRNIGSRQDGLADGENISVSRDCPLALPFADALTISRIAGPLSINRKYQSLFLGALRSHFEDSHRIMQQDDVFAVKFDKSKAQWAVEETEETNTEDLYDVNLPSPWESADELADAVVYFKVTDITPELVESDSKGSQLNTDWVQDLARAGQFGCVVDTSLTKMVQAGVSKMRVTEADDWLDVTSSVPPLPSLTSPLAASDSVYAQLLRLVQATLMPRAADYGLHLSVLLKGARGSGKRSVAHWVAQQTGIHLIELNCFDLIGDSDARTEGILRARCEQAASCAPAIVLLRHVDALARKSQSLETGQEPTMASVLQDCVAGLKRASTSSEAGSPPLPIAVIGTTGDAERCPTGVLACFKHELAFEAPNEAMRRAMLESLLQKSTLSADVSLKSLATQTAALVAADLADLVRRAQLAAVERIEESAGSEKGNDASLVQAGIALTGADFDQALNKARQSYSDNIGAPKIPNVTWDDVGGLASVKDDILDTIQLPLEHPELFANGMKKRSGILLYGPPGTGKTLLAKAVATSCSLNFFSVKGPELLNMYIGESEANVRRVFQRARDAKPCVIFFDELDSIAPKRGNQGDSGGVMDRIVSQLLAELDGMSSGGSSADVFVIGATNRPDLLDPALLRPGRFDRMLYLAVSGTHTEQLNILQALTRKFKLDDDVGDLSVVAEQCPLNLTGADFYALCSDAMLKSMTRKAEWIDEEVKRLNGTVQASASIGAAVAHPVPLTTQYYLDEMTAPADLDVRVSRTDFEAALAELVPSVSAQEMEHYRSVQARFSSTDSPDEDNSGTQKETQAPRVNGFHPPIEADQSATAAERDAQTVGELMAAMQRTQLREGEIGSRSEPSIEAAPSNGSLTASNGRSDASTPADAHSTQQNGEPAFPQDSPEDVSQRRQSKGKGKARQ